MTYDEIEKMKRASTAIDALHKVTRTAGGFDFHALRVFFDNPAIDQEIKRGLAQSIGQKLEGACENLRQRLIDDMNLLAAEGAFGEVKELGKVAQEPARPTGSMLPPRPPPMRTAGAPAGTIVRPGDDPIF